MSELQRIILILQLIAKLWPMVEKLLGAIEDPEKKKAAEDTVAKAVKDVITITA